MAGPRGPTGTGYGSGTASPPRRSELARALQLPGPGGIAGAAAVGTPATYTPEQVSEVIATSLTKPQELGLPFASWTLDRLAAYLRRSRASRSSARGSTSCCCRRLALAPAGDLVWRAGRSRLRRKKGAITTLYTTPPPGSVVICLDEMGPESAKSFPGQELVRSRPVCGVLIGLNTRMEANVPPAAGPRAGHGRPGAPPKRSTMGAVARAISSAPSARQRRGAHRALRGADDGQLGRLPGAGRGLVPLTSSGSTRSWIT